MSIISVGGYIRVSTQEQSTRGLSLESQQTDIEEYCRSKGYHLTKLYIDRGISARKNLNKRTAFMNMMKDVKDGVINHIIVIRLDRFFRNVYDYHRMMNEYMIPYGCGWSAVKEDYDTTTTNGRLMINLRLAIAEQECDQDSDRIKDVLANRVREGYAINGSQPYGLTIKDKRVVPDDNAWIVKEIYKDFIFTGSSVKTLDNINQRYGINFDYNRLVRVLRTKKYIGVFRDNENYCPAIIDKDDFYKAGAMLDKNKRVLKNKRYYIFSGILYCSECGHRYAGFTPYKSKERSYRCNNSYTNHKCSNRRTLPEKYIEQYLLNNVEDLLKDYIVNIEANAINPKRKLSNRKEIEGKIQRLTDLYIDGSISLEDYKERKKNLESQIIDESEDDKKEVDMDRLNEFLNSGFQYIYSDLTSEERSYFWRELIKEIRINTDIESVIFL